MTRRSGPVASPSGVTEQLACVLIGFGAGIPIAHLLGHPLLPLFVSALAIAAGFGLAITARASAATLGPPRLTTTGGRAVGADGESSVTWQLATDMFPGGLAVVRVEERRPGGTLAGWPTDEVTLRVEPENGDAYVTRQAIGVERGHERMLAPGSVHLAGRVDAMSPDILLISRPDPALADRVRRGLSPAALATTVRWDRPRTPPRRTEPLLWAGTTVLTALTTALLSAGLQPLLDSGALRILEHL